MSDETDNGKRPQLTLISDNPKLVATNSPAEIE